MNRQKLKQYRALQKEIPSLQKKLERLYAKRIDIPVVLGKVTGSSKDWPYIPESITVQMDAPKEADALGRQIQANERRLGNAENEKAEIEEFIATIAEPIDRLIFEYSFLGEKRLSQRKIGEVVGCDQATVSRIIKKYFNDA